MRPLATKIEKASLEPPYPPPESCHPPTPGYPRVHRRVVKHRCAGKQARELIDSRVLISPTSAPTTFVQTVVCWELDSSGQRSCQMVLLSCCPVMLSSCRHVIVSPFASFPFLSQIQSSTCRYTRPLSLHTHSLAPQPLGLHWSDDPRD